MVKVTVPPSPPCATRSVNAPSQVAVPPSPPFKVNVILAAPVLSKGIAAVAVERTRMDVLSNSIAVCAVLVKVPLSKLVVTWAKLSSAIKKQRQKNTVDFVIINRSY